MKRILALLLVFVLMPVACAREYPVRGPGGGIAMTVTLPEGFNPATDRCPMVILMHGIFSSKDFVPMPALSRSLATAGCGMRTERIAQEINLRGLHHRKDGLPVTSEQVYAVCMTNKGVFCKDGGLIRLLM